jgi:NADP-dependent 3-hydroxy acid dehydrogenase YdfG
MSERAHATGSLVGRVAVVFGATGWIGRAICHELLRAGASVVVVGRDASRLAAFERELAGGDRVLSAVADVTSQLDVDDTQVAALTRFGHVDLLVVASGVITGSAFGEGVPADWAEMIDANLRGLLHACQTFADPLMQVAQDGSPADIMLIGAVSTDVREPRFAVFNALSAAIKQLARALRLEYGPNGMRVHIIEPSFASAPAKGQPHGAVSGEDSQHARANADVQPEAIAAVVALAAALPRRSSTATHRHAMTAGVSAPSRAKAAIGLSRTLVSRLLATPEAVRGTLILIAGTVTALIWANQQINLRVPMTPSGICRSDSTPETSGSSWTSSTGSTTCSWQPSSLTSPSKFVENSNSGNSVTGGEQASRSSPLLRA